MGTHRIDRAEIDLEVGDVALAEQLIERVSRLRERGIAPLLDRVCSELAGPEQPGRRGRVWRIERLELDLGAVAVESFEDDFLRKLEAALRAALGRELAARGTVPAERDARELLEVFARTGNVPWWADRSDPALIAGHLRALLHEAPHALLGLVRALSSDPAALARLARHCDDALLDDLVAAIHPDAGAELREAVHELERLLAGGGGSGRDQQARARSALLAALADTDAGAPALLPAMLHELANASPPVWRALAAGPRPVTPALREALAQVGVELAAPAHAAPAERDHDASPRAGRDRDESPPADRDRDARALAPAGESAPDSRPTTHARALAPAGPGEHDTPHAAHGTVSNDPSGRAGPDARAHHALAPDAQAHHALAPDARAHHALAPDAPAHHALAHTPARAPGTRPPRDPREAAAARRRALEQLEELHVEDAGLVILWPFLDRFFQNVGVVDAEHRFTGEPARMQAIALLSQLAAEDPDPPEYRLPLAKLLCGLSPADDFALDHPLAPAQLAECERLLAAVIDHASILRGMAVASFRATFLCRAGVLGVHNGAWLLQVERQTHDLVLDRFPWSWTWVKLPWMTDPLRVEW